MNQRQPELEVGTSNGAHALDDVFKGIWEKTRAAGELINHLRDEKRDLLERLENLERASAERLKTHEKEISALRADLTSKDQDLKRLRTEHTQLLSSNGHHSFSEEERAILKDRIRDLITKINSYL